MRIHILLPFCAALAALTAAGCSSTLSSNVKSQGVYGVSDVSATGGVATCTTSLQVGGATGTYMDLDGGDQLLCNGVKMTKSTDVFNRITYNANVPYQAQGSYQVSFVRSDETMYANMTLPSEIKGAQIEGGPTQTISQPLSVTWQKSSLTSESLSANLLVSSQHQDSGPGAHLTDGAPETGRISFRAEDTEITKTDVKTQAREHVQGPYSGIVRVARVTNGNLTGSWSGQASAAQNVDLPITLQEPAH